MDYEFDDIKIPTRPEEYSLPLDTVLSFVYCDQPEGLAMSVYAAGKNRKYLGRGRIELTDGFFKISELTMIDPFLRDRNFIPSSYMKIFYRVYLPKLKNSGAEIVCEPEFSNTPAVKLTISNVKDRSADIDVLWQANRNIFKTADKFTGYVIADKRIYKGDEDILRDIPYEFSGSYAAEGKEYEHLRRIYDEASYLFELKDTSFLRRIPETAVNKPKQDIYAQEAKKTAAVPDKAALQGTVRTFSGPALLTLKIQPYRRSVATRFLTFIAEMKRLADYVPASAQFVPFTCYWPTYSAMSREQRAWYFYWRSEYRKGNKLPTSISYIFEYIYELINRAYGTAEEGFNSLMRLWSDYREEFISLDHYMPRWCMDYIFVNKLDIKLDVILQTIPVSAQRLMPVKDIFINDKLSEGLHALDFSMLCEYSEYDIRGSKFYASHKEEYEEKLRACLAQIDKLMRKSKGQGILEYLAPPSEKYAWETYNGAVCSRAASKYITIEVIPYSLSPRIKRFVGNVARYMENLLRKREKVNGRLRNIALSAPVMAAIERVVEGKTTYTAKPDTPVFTVDLERARTLENESWDNTQKLIDAVEAAEDKMDDADKTAEIIELPSLSQEKPKEENISYEAVEAGSEWDVFINKLSELQKEILTDVINHDSASAESAASQAFIFADTVYEEINDLAADIIGDIIIDISCGELYEEWRDAACNALEIEA